jgi:anthranilate phosphoribosyltransferase
MIRDAIKKVISGQNISEQEMMAAMSEIMDGQTTDAQIACLITALRIKGETVEEIAGAAKVMRQKATAVKVISPGPLIDTCGTGGDGAHTFNISTAAAFVAAGAGVRIAKHGNRSVSSKSGSADVMEALGINITIPPEAIARCIDTVGIGFLFAQKLHLAMRHAARARSEIGIRTIFNILGPLSNPADADMQVLGVYDPALIQTIGCALQMLGRTRALVVHGHDGLDEISITGPSIICEVGGGTVKTYTIRPADVGLSETPIDAIIGGGPDENADIILNILRGMLGPHRDIVLLNAGAAIMLSGLADSLIEGMRLAARAIDAGKALSKLLQLKNLTQELAS